VDTSNLGSRIRLHTRMTRLKSPERSTVTILLWESADLVEAEEFLACSVGEGTARARRIVCIQAALVPNLSEARETAAAHTHSLTRQKGVTELRPPKGKRNRRVELSDSDLRILRLHHELQLKQIATEWVFANTEGKPLHRRNFLHSTWRRIVDLADLNPLRFHDLRHTSATLGLADGMPVKVVQERLGHASAKMTLDVHAKVVP